MTGPGPVSMAHPDMLALMFDVEAEQVDWARASSGRQRGYTYAHDDGRDVTGPLRRMVTMGLVRRCNGPGARNSGTVELDTAGIFHLRTETMRVLLGALTGIPWGRLVTGLDDNLSTDLTVRDQGCDRIVKLLTKRARLPLQTIARACAVQPATVRHWQYGNRSPNGATYVRLRYLADVVAVLAGTCTPRGVNQWLTAPNRRAGDIPVAMMAVDAAGRRAVLEAAEWMCGDGLA